MTTLADRLAVHRRRLPSARRLVRFAALAAATATVLTNAYYLRFLEPRVPRRWMAAALLAAAAVAVAVTEWGVPRGRAQWRALARRGAEPLLLVAILALAFGLRVWGISGGLPQSYVADEYDFVHAGLRMMKGGDLNPHWWFHPSLQRYLALATYTAVFLAGVPQGRWSRVAQVTEEDMLYWGRFVGVMAGTATVLVAYLLGRRLFGARAGLLAAALLAVFPAAVQHSQYNKPDPVVALLTAVSVLVTLVYLQRGGGARALAGGVTIGLAASAKYNGILVVVPFLLAVAFRLGRRMLTRADLYLGAAGTLLGFLMGCPFFLTEIHLFLDQVAYDISTYAHEGREGAEGVDNWASHGVWTSRYGAGYWASRAGLAGLALALYRIDAARAVFLSFPVLYFGYYGAQRINFRGNLLPVYPFLAVLAAYATVELLGWLQRTRLGRRRVVVAVAGAVLLGLLIAPPLWTSVRFDVESTRPDTGNAAREWIDRTFPPGTHFAVERFTPVLDTTRYSVVQEPRLVNRSLRSYRDDGVQYLIVSSMAYDRYGPEHNQTRSYQKLFALCPLVAEFPPIPGQRIGPTIRILKVPPATAADKDS
jgi:4-amino-4-deoxy-L-arabinose transferase-like glycosyltransferase